MVYKKNSEAEQKILKMENIIRVKYAKVSEIMGAILVDKIQRGLLEKCTRRT